MGIKRPRVFFDVQIGGIPVGRCGLLIIAIHLTILVILLTILTITFTLFATTLPLARIVMQLFADVCPRTVENFRWI